MGAVGSGERGAVAVLGIAVAGVLLMIGIAVLDVSAVVSARTRSQTAGGRRSAGRGPGHIQPCISSPGGGRPHGRGQRRPAGLVPVPDRSAPDGADRDGEDRRGGPSVAVGGSDGVRPVPGGVHSLPWGGMSAKRAGATRATVALERAGVPFRLCSYQVDYRAVADYGRAVCPGAGRRGSAAVQDPGCFRRRPAPGGGWSRPMSG